jgi:hypothetical protein
MKKLTLVSFVFTAASVACSSSDPGSSPSSTNNAGTVGNSTAPKGGGTSSGGSIVAGGVIGKTASGDGGHAAGGRTGASAMGGSVTSGSATGGSATGGSATGGSAAGGSSSGIGGASARSGATGLGGKSANGGVTSVAGGATAKGGSVNIGGSSGGGSSSNGGAAIGGSTSGGGSSGTDIYVSPAGDDSNPGTLDQPLKTIAKARDLVRAMTSAMKSDINVYLRGGTYPQSSTLTFANADSGTGGFYVKYLAYSGERPLVTGGKPITGWTVADATNNIYSATAGTTAFRQLYVNGKKAIRARSPNLGASSAPNFNRLSGWDKTAHNVQVPSSVIGNWKNLTKVEMHINIAWGDSILRIASTSTTGDTAYVKFQADEDAIVFVRPNPRMDQVGWGKGRAYYFENALEFLDQPGEWYLDETTGTVYYKPGTGEDMSTATVIAPMVETIASINGTSTTSQASYLWFQGLTFAHSTFMRPSEHGFLDAQAGQYNLTAQSNNDQTIGRPPAGVSVTNANHIRFERNLFTQMGATGLDFISGTHDDTIIGNAITDIAGNGISIGKFTANETTEYHIAYNPSDKNEICTRDTIKDNFVDNVTTEFFGGVGIGAGYPAYLDIEHNEISHTNYTGISVGYGWTGSTTAMTNNKINYNNIHHVNQVMTDGGAIYTLSNQGTGSEMQYNYVHDYSCSQWADYGCNGLYMDEKTSGYTVAHNVLSNCPTNIAQNQVGTNTITDNGASPQGAQNTIATAGIESSYADIKTLTVPDAKF